MIYIISVSLSNPALTSLEQYNPQHPQSPLPYSQRTINICCFVCEHAGSLLRCLAQLSKTGVFTWAEEDISHLQSRSLQTRFANGQTTQQQDKIKLAVWGRWDNRKCGENAQPWKPGDGLKEDIALNKGSNSALIFECKWDVQTSNILQASFLLISCDLIRIQQSYTCFPISKLITI